jgi:hypothetical protein
VASALEQVVGWARGGGRRGRWRRRVARRLLAAVLAATAVVGGVAVARTPEGGPSVTVLLAARDLPAGHLVGAADLVGQRRPRDYAPAAAPMEATDAVGRHLAGPVLAGEVVTPGRLLGPGLLAGRPAGDVALHVPVAGPGVSGLVSPGDRVDLVAATGAAVARGATVLAVPPGDPSSPALVVAVTEDEAGRIAGAPGDETGLALLTVVLRHAESLR